MEPTPAPDRRSIRLPYWDYASPGLYFLTLCVEKRACVLGRVEGSRLVASPLGDLVAETWRSLPDRFPGLVLDEWTILPNHMHGIVALTGASRRKPLGGIVGAFKTLSTKRINALRGTPGAGFWQRGYYERVIRYGDDDVRELNSIRQYIALNLVGWEEDHLNPRALPTSDPETPWSDRGGGP